jgi:hypothetical protein
MFTPYRHLNSILFAAALLAAAAAPACAALLTGNYDTGTSSGSQTTPANDPTGPWTLTSTDSTFSFLLRPTNENPMFSQLTNLNAVFASPALNVLPGQNQPNAGGGGGAPRFRLQLDTTGDLVGDGSITIHLGTAPNYIDDPAALTLHSGMNLIGNNDAGRYDLSDPAFGGSNFTNYNAALALLGNAKVMRMGIVLDSFGGADKSLVVTSLNGEFVPEPATIALLGIATGGLGFFVSRRRPRA